MKIVITLEKQSQFKLYKEDAQEIVDIITPTIKGLGWDEGHKFGGLKKFNIEIQEEEQ